VKKYVISCTRRLWGGRAPYPARRPQTTVAVTEVTGKGSGYVTPSIPKDGKKKRREKLS